MSGVRPGLRLRRGGRGLHLPRGHKVRNIFRTVSNIFTPAHCSRCVMCKCLPSKCDCNPLAEDPDSFCSGDDVCKVGGILSTYLQCTYLHITYISTIAQDCVCQPRYPPGCTCDPFSPDPDSSCPGQQTCKQCKCLGEWFIVSTVHTCLHGVHVSNVSLGLIMLPPSPL